jgi:hypothetical protein
MKITVVGALAVVAAVVLFALLAYQVGIELDKNTRKDNERPNGSF